MKNDKSRDEFQKHLAAFKTKDTPLNESTLNEEWLDGNTWADTYPKEFKKIKKIAKDTLRGHFEDFCVSWENDLQDKVDPILKEEADFGEVFSVMFYQYSRELQRECQLDNFFE